MTKKIHYCWFGGKPLPKSVKDCIKTWKKFLPDYEIKEWNESNFDINSFPFVKEAYESKKWAFVSDYVRIYALYKEGGLYLDTDMKILKDPSDIFNKDMILGFEDSGYVGTAMIYVQEAKNKYIKEIMEYYNKIKHFNPEIMYNFANPVIITKTLQKYDSVLINNNITVVDGNVYVYPREYFYPLNYNYSEKVYTQNTYMVHLFKATWTDNGEKRTIGIYRTFGPSAGKRINHAIDFIFGLKNKMINLLKKLYCWLRMKASIYINRGKRVRRIQEELSQKKEEYLVIAHPDLNEETEGIIPLLKNECLYVREQYTNKEARLIAQAIADTGKKTVIFNSYIDGWDKIIKELKNTNQNISIKVLIHKNHDSLKEDCIWNYFDLLLDLYNKKWVNEFVVFRKNLYEFYKQKGYKVSYLSKYLANEEIPQIKETAIENDYIRIGIYNAENKENKEIYNQICAISLMDLAKLDCIPLNYKVAKICRRFNVNVGGKSGKVSRKEMQQKMAQNDINLFISEFDETSIMPLESLELGTICLVDNNSEYFRDSELEKYLVLEKQNDIIEIYNKIKYALQNKEKILELYKNWKVKYNAKAEENVKKFLEK